MTSGMSPSAIAVCCRLGTSLLLACATTPAIADPGHCNQDRIIAAIDSSHQVPSLRGCSPDAARLALQSRDYGLTIENRVDSNTIPAGRIVRQRVQSSNVYVVVSTGPEHQLNGGGEDYGQGGHHGGFLGGVVGGVIGGVIGGALTHPPANPNAPPPPVQPPAAPPPQYEPPPPPQPVEPTPVQKILGEPPPQPDPQPPAPPVAPPPPIPVPAPLPADPQPHAKPPPPHHDPNPDAAPPHAPPAGGHAAVPAPGVAPVTPDVPPVIAKPPAVPQPEDPTLRRPPVVPPVFSIEGSPSVNEGGKVQIFIRRQGDDRNIHHLVLRYSDASLLSSPPGFYDFHPGPKNQLTLGLPTSAGERDDGNHSLSITLASTDAAQVRAPDSVTVVIVDQLSWWRKLLERLAASPLLVAAIAATAALGTAGVAKFLWPRATCSIEGKSFALHPVPVGNAWPSLHVDVIIGSAEFSIPRPLPIRRPEDVEPSPA